MHHRVKMNIELSGAVAFAAPDSGNHIADCRAMAKPVYQLLNRKFGAVSAIAALDREAVAGNHCQQCAVFYHLPSVPFLPRIQRKRNLPGSVFSTGFRRPEWQSHNRNSTSINMSPIQSLQNWPCRTGLAELEAGTVPWRKPWSGGGGLSIPVRATGESYRGIRACCA